MQFAHGDEPEAHTPRGLATARHRRIRGRNRAAARQTSGPCSLLRSGQHEVGIQQSEQAGQLDLEIGDRITVDVALDDSRGSGFVPDAVRTRSRASPPKGTDSGEIDDVRGVSPLDEVDGVIRAD